MELDRIGYNHCHGDGFVIDIPKEFSWWLFLLIKTPAVFRIDGEEIITKPNSFILFSHGTPQYYKAYNGDYIDDWFHLIINEEDISYFKALGIPINQVVPLPNADDISMTIRKMAYEFYNEGKYKNRIIKSMLDIIFLTLSRQLNENSSEFCPINDSNYDELLTIRNDIFNYPQRKWSVDEIAKSVSISRSTVQHAYKNAFGVSISQDVISSRIRRAKYYLTSTNLTISKIAELCGYNSTVFFTRQFKNVEGKSPTEYRSKI